MQLSSLLLLALSKRVLQDKIELLEKYCRDWGLKLNLKKTKILIFNKQGTVVKRHKCYFQVKEIEIFNQYTYLGFTFIPSGVMKLINKARKAWFSIHKMKNKHLPHILSLWTQQSSQFCFTHVNAWEMH